MHKRAQEINRHVLESIELKRKRKIADAEKEREDERRMIETLAAAEQKAKEAEEERNAVKRERLKAMKDCLEDQIHLKDLRVRKEYAEMALQGKIWKEEADEANRKEAADKEHRRQMRQNLDRALIKQLEVV